MVQPAPRQHSCSRMCRYHARGSFLAAYGKGWPKAVTTAQTARQTATPAQEVEPQQEGTTSQQPSPTPGFVEIAWSLQGSSWHSSRIGWRSGSHSDGGVLNVICLAVPGCNIRGHEYWYGDMFNELGRHGNYFPHGLLPHPHSPRWSRLRLGTWPPSSVIVHPSLAMLNCSYLACLPGHILYVSYLCFLYPS